MDDKKKLIEKIVEGTDKSYKEIEKLISEKVNELSGLVSEEGAIHILANELGVKLEHATAKRPIDSYEHVKIKDISEPKVSVSFVCKVIRKYDKVVFSSENNPNGSVQSVFVGDETGTTRLVFWNDKTELLESVKEGSILSVANGYTRENNNTQKVEVHFGQYSDIEIEPEGVEIGDIPMTAESFEFSPKKVEELEEGDSNIHLEGVVTDVELPRFYHACPKTFKKVFEDNGKYISPTEGEVEPVRVPIVNLHLDDGTGTIPIVGFRDRAESVTGFTTDELIGLSEDIEKYKNFSKKMVGSKLKVGGNVSISSLTQEKQFIISQVLGVEFKTVEELADELSEEDDKEKKEKKELKKDEEDSNLDIDVDEIDIDDEDLM